MFKFIKKHWGKGKDIQKVAERQHQENVDANKQSHEHDKEKTAPEKHLSDTGSLTN